MATIIESGTGRNLTNTKVGEGLAPDPTERKFVTYAHETGAVHTIIVDIEHAAKDAEELLAWFDHTRATVTHRSGPEHTPNHITPAEVLRLADEALGLVAHETEQPAPAGQDTISGGGQ